MALSTRRRPSRTQPWGRAAVGWSAHEPALTDCAAYVEILTADASAGSTVDGAIPIVLRLMDVYALPTAPWWQSPAVSARNRWHTNRWPSLLLTIRRRSFSSSRCCIGSDPDEIKCPSVGASCEAPIVLGVCPAVYSLKCEARYLTDPARTLSSYGVGPGSTVSAMMGVLGGGSRKAKERKDRLVAQAKRTGHAELCCAGGHA